MKIVKYDPKTVDNVPAFFNSYIDEMKGEKYVMFVFKDIYESAKDGEALVKKYEELLSTLDIPYSFFSYYAHFNKVMPGYSSMPCPRMRLKSKDGFDFEVVQDPAYGLLVLDLEKLRSINFRFNEKYKLAFYIQDLIKACFDNKIYFSKAFFIDVFHSEEMFNSTFDNVFLFDVKTFLEEKKTYYADNGNTVSEKINDYVKTLKEKYGTPEPKKEEATQPENRQVEMKAFNQNEATENENK